jgi:sulfotransferase 6B1
MIRPLQNRLSSRNGLVRKAAAAVLAMPKWWRSLRARPSDYLAQPPVLANSFPKSGTHLLFQLVDGLPDATNYGAFLASMTSSRRFRERSPQNASRFIRGFVPGEIVRGHLFFHPQNAADLSQKNVVHYFVYRDPRDVVVSEAHYLREMNRWHRLGPYFRNCDSLQDAIMLSITGFDPPRPGLEYPDIAARFARYAGWLHSHDCLPIRFEDLASERREAVIRQLAQFYATRRADRIDVEACAADMISRIAPEKSHTYRRGKKAGWQSEFTPEHRRVFDELAGDLLIELGYESNHDWVRAPTPLSGTVA